ncbi:MAG: Coenzyme F420 hydrogenase/dehydrogenase, beta subunit C-terminal domain [Clostridium sp.]|nr:Coenzyme F420 hydrogenase/dehydrogenase, beta subunit C-terminal domain [Prevotella sp.]MCM1429485.1 Coenzyme F420 hydrogenase/dehydrogenase, beta subunit C-terminal domain [Clostridium sp.]MCM1476101.1 Coenzyme F420 hydrogenase/dehydrogenase, beta subunit C-terminal domain [Muribaculaceae bacterium]
MIEIKRKEECVGCGACEQRCPQQCISLSLDEQGFRYPVVDRLLCVECGLCERVCPVIHRATPSEPLAVKAAKNRDSAIRETSSSGGIFSALAMQTLHRGGVVFGAAFDEDRNVCHHHITSPANLHLLTGSKYVKSDTAESYREAERLLKEGREVLYSGTPCQIAGLKRYLMRDYGGQLTTVGVACHGVPSPKVWQEYLGKRIGEENKPKIQRINFRDKRKGWTTTGLSIRYVDNGGKEKEHYEKAYDSDYLYGYQRDWFLRPSCFECPAKGGRYEADVTLADYWGIGDEHPDFYDDSGVSLILIHTRRGEGAVESLDIESIDSEYAKGKAHNRYLEESATCPHPGYEEFWRRYSEKGIETLSEMAAESRPPYLTKLKDDISVYLKKLLRKFLR